MTLDPQTVAPLTRVTATDLGETLTTHGLLDMSTDTPRLIELDRDYSGERLPVSVPLEGLDVTVDDADGAYVVVRGHMTCPTGRPSFGTVAMTVSDQDVFGPELAEHASETSMTAAYDTVSDILSEYSDPLPERYVVETAIERGITRNTVEDVITRMESAGNIYSPEAGIIGGM